MVYLAMYKAKGNWVDWVIRKTTGYPYSHCELAIPAGNGQYHCYSSSPRDGGVRCKTMPLPEADWDLLPLRQTSGGKIVNFYQRTQGKKYDFFGAIGVVLGIREKPNRWYCSEWCYQAITGKPAQLSPNQLAKWAKMLARYGH